MVAGPFRRTLLLCTIVFPCLPAVAQDAAIARHEQRAQQLLQARQPAEARNEFAAIVALDPHNVNAQANLGVLLYFAGQVKEAEPHLRTALALDATQTKLRALLGFCEHRAGELDEARKDLVEAFPTLADPKVRKQAGLELVEIDTARSDLPAAAQVISQLKTTAPADPEILYAAYRVYTDLAGEAMLDLSMAAPDSAQLHQAMAHELVRERDNAAAVTNLRAALAADPTLPGARFELAEVLRLSSEPAQKAQAQEQYELALKQNPNDAIAMTRLGDIAADKADHGTAIAHYKQALALRPADEEAAIGLAHELTETGQPEAALPLLEGAVKADPTNVLAHYRLSALYRRLHRPEDARREIAEYERLKAIKDKLRGVYEALRQNAPHSDDARN